MDDESDEFSAATLRRMVREVRPEWRLRGAEPSAEGTDAVYFVTVETPDGPRECVLKACEFLEPEAFRPEPHLSTLVARRTSIPVPGVVGAVDDHDELPAPFFLMERLDGEVREDEARDLPTEAVERLARDAGRHLGELHRLGDFEGFGPVRLARDADRPRPGATVDARTLAVDVTDGGSWCAQLARTADDCLPELHPRFEELGPDLREFVDDRLDALDREFTPVFGHDDYRLGNLLVDPETGETRAVLDWGNAHTLDAHYNLVVTEQYLSGWALRDDPLRQRVRTALREGYEATNGLARDAGFERRRELYLGLTRLFPLTWFSLWYGDATDSEREETAARHRQAVRELVD